MSVSMYLKIPQIVGSSTDEGFAGAITVLAFSWGASNPGTVISGPGKVNIQDLSVTAYQDTATSPLSTNLFKGVIMKQAVLTLVYPSAPMDVYTLTDVMVSALSSGGSGGEDRLTVNYTFNFAQLNFLLSGKRTTWNLRTNSP